MMHWVWNRTPRQPRKSTSGVCRAHRPGRARKGCLVVAAVAAVVWLGPQTAHASQPTTLARQQSDAERIAALEARVAALERSLQQTNERFGTRLEELEQRLIAPQEMRPDAAGQEAAPTPENAERAAFQDELARALAALEDQPEEAATPASAPTADDRQFTDRARNMRELNPEISVSGDVFGTWADRSGDPTVNRFTLGEFEVAFQAPLDPFSQARAFLVEEDGEVGAEELYIDWTTLPGGLGVKFGRFRNDFGKLNRWHNHALPQVDRPLAHRAFLGEGGLAGLGVSLSWLPPTFLGDYNELWVQVTNDDNDVAFSGRGFDTPVITLHETNYWDLSPSTYFELGLSAATGVNDADGRFRSWVLGADVNLVWSPPAEARYKGLELRGEVLYERRERPDGVLGSWGGYLFATRKLGPRWSIGLRGDFTELPDEPGESVWGLTPYAEWWQSEWAKLRFQYSYGSRRLEDKDRDNRFSIQVIWALGPHKHEKY